MSGDFIHGMPMKEYRALPGVGFHDLMDFGKSPLFFYRKRIMKVIPDWSSDAMDFGTCVHALVLEGQNAFTAACVQCPDRFVTKGGAVSESKDAKAWAAEQGDKIILSPDDWNLATTLSVKVHANKRAHELLTNGKAEVVSRWKHRSGVECRSRADWLTDTYIVDLKTCYSLNDFEADIVKWNYHAQCSFYAEAFQRSNAYLIAVEKSEPHAVGIWKIGPNALGIGRQKNDELFLKLAFAQETDVWPGDFDERIFELPNQTKETP